MTKLIPINRESGPIILTPEQRLKALIRSHVRQLRHRRAMVRREHEAKSGRQ